MDLHSPGPSDRMFEVVVNEEEQYSLWPTHRLLPNGWMKSGYVGNKDECLRYIETVWTDMRPKSLRPITDTK